MFYMHATESENEVHIHTRDGEKNNVLIFVIKISCVTLKIINIIYAAFVFPLSETLMMFFFSRVFALWSAFGYAWLKMN